MRNSDNFKRGTAEMLILHLLQKGDLTAMRSLKPLKKKAAASIIFWKARFTTFCFA